MGSAASRIGQPISKRGTQFIGDIRGQAAYGLPLESHPIQQVVAKSEPANYIANVLYPKASASGLPLLMPRSYVRRKTVFLFLSKFPGLDPSQRRSPMGLLA